MGAGSQRLPSGPGKVEGHGGGPGAGSPHAEALSGRASRGLFMADKGHFSVGLSVCFLLENDAQKAPKSHHNSATCNQQTIIRWLVWLPFHQQKTLWGLVQFFKKFFKRRCSQNSSC